MEIVQGRNVQFIILNEKIIVCTNLQAFILEPSDYFWNKRLETIKVLIRMGQIDDLDSLASSCKTYIQWIPTRIPVMS